jgi:nitrile hydratase alpha subunit
VEQQGDRDRTIVAMVTARAWRDPAFRQRLVSDPKSVLAEEGLEVPAGTDVQVFEDTATVKYVNLTRDAQDAPPQQLSALFERLLPIPAGHEVRVVQSTDQVWCLVLPYPPAGADPASLSDAQVMGLVSDSGVQSTYQDTTEAVVAEQAEAAVTTTSEAQDVETTSTVVAEFEVVLVI